MKLTKLQTQIRNSKSRFKVLICGRRWGKTVFSISQLLEHASKPNQRVWYVAPTYRQAEQIVWTQLKEILREKFWVRKLNETKLTADLVNGSLIALKGADNYDGLRGVGLNFLCIDEFADVNDKAWFEVLRPTLSDTKGKALFCGTPKGFNWAYELFKKGQVDDEWASWQYTTLDGGFVDVNEVEQARQDLDERTFKQEYEASFVTYSGSVYYAFDRRENVKDIKMDSSTIHIGLDFNIDPMSACCMQIKNNVVSVFDEIVIYGSNTDEMVNEIYTRYGNQRIIIYPDPSARANRTSAGGRTDLSILRNAGFLVKINNVAPLIRDRINAVNSRLLGADDVRRLFVDKRCLNVIRSLERQIYKEGTSQPDKENGYDHMNDALGYAIETLFPIRRNYIPKPQQERWS
tara:strand:- start:52 stop:1266 length:1215 start_codon:yes stop_codon:yes gene_type:complete